MNAGELQTFAANAALGAIAMTAASMIVGAIYWWLFGGRSERR